MIEAYVDGECPVEEAEALREHLRVCPACRVRAEQLSALQEMIHRALSAETEPPDLWRKIAGRLDQHHAPSPATPRRGAWDGLRRLAAVAGVLIIIVGGAVALRSQAPSEQTVVRETVQDFVTFQLSGRPFDNVATDPTVVRAWFAGKIQFELPSMKASAAGYDLIGSRLCWLLERRLGAFTYRRGDRFMTLYVMDGEAVTLSGTRHDPILGAVAARRSVGGYNSLVWSRGNLIYSLVSNAPHDEMTAFAAEAVDSDQQFTWRDDDPGPRTAAPQGRLSTAAMRPGPA